jgi:uncharacterized membrane protein YeaQ/YmgE (transglycosylase-associated protein family)
VTGAALAVVAADRSWAEIPGVRILGAVIGAVLLIAAIRAMFSGRR